MKAKYKVNVDSSNTIHFYYKAKYRLAKELYEGEDWLQS